MRSDNSEIGTIIFMIVLVLVICSIGSSCSRSSQGMAKISGNLCYDKETYIVYREERIGYKSLEYHYEPYYNKSGKMVTYNPYTQTFEEINDNDENRDVSSSYGTE